MLTDLVVEACSTQGIVPYALGGATGSYKSWRSKVGNGATVFYVAKSTNGAKIEKGYGVLTYGTPDTLTRVVLESSNANAAINWQQSDIYVVYCAPVLDVIAPLMFGTGFTGRPAWAQAGLRWTDWSAAIGTRLTDKLFNGTADVETGRYEGGPGIYVPSPRHYWIDKGAASYVASTDDIGKVVLFNVTAASRTLTLPAGSAAGHGFRMRTLGYGASGNSVFITPAGTDAIDQGAGGATLSIPGWVSVTIEWDGAKAQWRTSYVAAAVAPAYAGVRQTVASGPVDSNGLPAFLPATAVVLSVTSQNVSGTAPLVASAAGGWNAATGMPADTVGVATGNLTWGSLANNTTNYLYATIAGGVLTPASTVLAPIYQRGGVPSTVNGQITFNIGEMKAYLGNGATAVPTALVVFGEAVTSAGAVASTVAYAYNGQYEGPATNTLPSATVPVSANHNIGVSPRQYDVVLTNLAAELGFSPGDQVDVRSAFGNGGSLPFTIRVNSKTIATVLANGVTWGVTNVTSGFVGSLTPANWSYRFIASRGW